MATTAVPRRAEIKTRTSSEIKAAATEVYSRWGLSLNDAIDTFLVKSIEVGGLPFDLRPEAPSYDALAAVAYTGASRNGTPTNRGTPHRG